MTKKLKNSSSGLLKENNFKNQEAFKTPLDPHKWSGVFFVSPWLSGCSVASEDKMFLLASGAILLSFLFSSLCLGVVYRLLKYQIKKNHLNHYLFTENAYGKQSCENCKNNGNENGSEGEANNDANMLRGTSQRINQNRKTVIDVSTTKLKPK